MVQYEFLNDKQALAGRQYVDNSPDELRVAVLEMADALENPQPPSRDQLEFRDLVTRLFQHPNNKKAFERKLGVVPSTAGDGFICRFFAERHLHLSGSHGAVM